MEIQRTNLSAIGSTTTPSMEKRHVMSPKPIASSTRPECPVPSTSNNASHATHHYGTTSSSSHDQGSLTPRVGNPSNAVSMLDLWVYENRKEALVLAERLEKKNWEAENSRL